MLLKKVISAEIYFIEKDLLIYNVFDHVTQPYSIEILNEKEKSIYG